MKLATLILSVLLAALFCPQAPIALAQQKPEDLAQKSAAFLALIDSGKYAESWEKTSQLFKSKVTKDQWVDAMNQVRAPLGAVQSRKLSSANYDKKPGPPEAEYVVLKYDTSFAQLPAAVETVSFTLDKDHKWRLAGYYIKHIYQ